MRQSQRNIVDGKWIYFATIARTYEYILYIYISVSDRSDRLYLLLSIYIVR